MLFIIKGLILGISIAAPVGPIGILCIRRTLARGMWIGFISGAGAATADAIYGSIAAFGISVVATFLFEHRAFLQIVGGIFLFYLGCKTFRAKPILTEVNEIGEGRIGAYVSTLFLTLTNPLTIISFMAVFAGIGGNGFEKSFYIVIGVFFGSMLWWFILSGIVSLVRRNFTTRHIKVVNRVSGTIITVFGVYSVLSTYSR